MGAKNEYIFQYAIICFQNVIKP